MFYFQKPTGGLYVGKRLLQPPHVSEHSANAPVRIVFVSDLHMRRGYEEILETVFSVTQALKPEMLIFGGDISEFDDGVNLFCERAKRMNVPYGMFAVEGNNDTQRFKGDEGAFRSELEKAGIRLLSNECAVVSIPRRQKMEIGGVADIFKHTPSAKGLFSSEEGVYRILVSHAPHAFLLRECETPPELMLSGHTHGGQINVLCFTCYELLGYERKFRFTHLSGDRRIGRSRVIVSNGIGTSKFPIRFGARPEIHLIT